MFSASKSKGASGSYQIANSLRFRSSASAYLNRTPGSAGNRQTWTWSAWVKLGDVSTSVKVVFGAYSTDPNSLLLYFGNNQFTVGSASGSPNANTAALFRDPSAWYHIVVAWDTTQATAANRIQIYVNGVAQTQVSVTSPSLNYNGYINASGVAHSFARSMGATPYYFDGYLAEINFVDGQALTPSSFGQTNPVTGVWQPIAYSGAYGTNGFKLNFSNGTSTTTLGYDSSGNGNNWTTNNISLTAGSTYDWMIDSPTSFAGTSYGVGNYAVLNPIQTGNALTVSNANLTVSDSGSSSPCSASTFAVDSGKWYWEVSVGGSYVYVGMTTIQTANTSIAYLGQISGQFMYNTSNYIDSRIDGVAYNYSTGSNAVTNDIIGVAIDFTANTVVFYKNGVSQGTFGSSFLNGRTWTPAFKSNASVSSNFNFGQRPFAYTPPSGYKSLCTQNLPTPTIQNGANYMAATLWTGNGTSQSISNAVNGISYQPDFVWVKSRSDTYSNWVTDSVRGNTKILSTNQTAAETTISTCITAFNSNGFSVGTDTAFNNNGSTYVGWQWKAGGTAVTNTAGSITSQVSANTTAGFAVVTFTNVPTTSAAYTIGHGLGVAPSFYIIKARSYVGNWDCYHASLGNNAKISLNLTNASTTPYGGWQTTSPTSSVFTINGSFFSTSTSDTFVAYCFAAIAGYSAFGSYTGNGSADGPFVYCGFRPRFVMVKRSSADSSGGNWIIKDASRPGYNTTNLNLFANSSTSETTEYPFDILSSGFKIRDTNVDINTSGATYIYAAFCESPFTNALAR